MSSFRNQICIVHNFESEEWKLFFIKTLSTSEVVNKTLVLLTDNEYKKVEPKLRSKLERVRVMVVVISPKFLDTMSSSQMTFRNLPSHVSLVLFLCGISEEELDNFEERFNKLDSIEKFDHDQYIPMLVQINDVIASEASIATLEERQVLICPDTVVQNLPTKVALILDEELKQKDKLFVKFVDQNLEVSTERVNATVYSFDCPSNLPEGRMVLDVFLNQELYGSQSIMVHCSKVSVDPFLNQFHLGLLSTVLDTLLKKSSSPPVITAVDKAICSYLDDQNLSSDQSKSVFAIPEAPVQCPTILHWAAKNNLTESFYKFEKLDTGGDARQSQDSNSHTPYDLLQASQPTKNTLAVPSSQNTERRKKENFINELQSMIGGSLQKSQFPIAPGQVSHTDNPGRFSDSSQGSRDSSFSNRSSSGGCSSGNETGNNRRSERNSNFMDGLNKPECKPPPPVPPRSHPAPVVSRKKTQPKNEELQQYMTMTGSTASGLSNISRNTNTLARKNS